MRIMNSRIIITLFLINSVFSIWDTDFEPDIEIDEKGRVFESKKEVKNVPRD